MKIHIMSDLHLEFGGFTPPAVEADVVVLAGDIGAGAHGLPWARRHFSDHVPVIYVPGNHEFYGSNIPDQLTELRKSAKQNGIHLLDMNEATIQGVRFLGATLWTDFKLFGEENIEMAMSAASYCLADFNYAIRGFDAQASRDLHHQAVAWLERKLTVASDQPTVVVTHHAPARGSLHEKWATDLASSGFVCGGIDHLLGTPKLWIHGHCHDSFDYTESGTRVVCNPRGYPLANGATENPGFDETLVIEID